MGRWSAEDPFSGQIVLKQRLDDTEEDLLLGLAEKEVLVEFRGP